MFRKFKIRKIVNDLKSVLRVKSTVVMFPYRDYPVDLTKDEAEAIGDAFPEDVWFAPIFIADEGDEAPIAICFVVSHNPLELWNVVYHQAVLFELPDDAPDLLPALREQIEQDSGVTLDEHPEPLPISRQLIEAMHKAIAEQNQR